MLIFIWLCIPLKSVTSFERGNKKLKLALKVMRIHFQHYHRLSSCFTFDLLFSPQLFVYRLCDWSFLGPLHLLVWTCHFFPPHLNNSSSDKSKHTVIHENHPSLCLHSLVRPLRIQFVLLPAQYVHMDTASLNQSVTVVCRALGK